MKFGVMLPHYRHVASTDSIYRVAQEAESMGFHSVWVSEHIAVPDGDVDRFGKGYYDMFTVLGYVAAITRRVLLGTSIVILPFRPPLHVAQLAATVDQLSKGRLILGVGVGSTEAEFPPLGASWDERGPITDESIQVLKHVWTVDQPNFQGRYFQFSAINSFPLLCSVRTHPSGSLEEAGAPYAGPPNTATPGIPAVPASSTWLSPYPGYGGWLRGLDVIPVASKWRCATR